MNETSNPDMPGWARRVDDYGRRRWHKDRPDKKYNRGNYIASIIFNLIWLWVINKVPDWNLRFINEHYTAVLWILNVNVLVQIGGNVLMFLVHIPAIRYLSRIFMEAAGFVTLISLYFIYPFDFSAVSGLVWLDVFLPIIFIIGMIVSALTVLSNIWKLIFWR